MASFVTEANSVSHGTEEFFAVDGVVEIPDDKLVHFGDFIASGLLALVEEPLGSETESESEPRSDDEKPKSGNAVKSKKAKS